VRQREPELAEQRRILAEEYRLLRARHTAGAPRVTVPPAAQPARFDAGSTPGFWGRVKRAMLSVSASTVEGS
jgi:hypothetical protein